MQRRRFRLLGAAVVSAAACVAALTSGPATAAHTDGAADTVIGSSFRPTADLEVMRLECDARDGDVAAIGCRWSIPDDAAGVRLVRVALGTGAGRVTVHRTDDPSDNTYVDTPVRRGVRYLYAVRAIDAAGRLVGASRSVVVGVPTPDDRPAVEVLRLECAATGVATARCRWGAPDEPARVLTLWRSVDGGARERVASFQAPFPTSYGDEVPASSFRAVYAVIATDGAGEIVARSRVDGVTFADVESTEPRPTETRPTETRPVETRPVDTRPVETRPVETRPVETRPVDTRPSETRPMETRPIETRPTETRQTETRPTETRPVETRPAETRPTVAEVRSDSASSRDGDRTN